MAQLADASNTFEGVTREWISKKKVGWTLYYTRQVERFLETDENTVWVLALVHTARLWPPVNG